MNILFIHEIDWLKKVVFEIHNLAESLSRLGHRVYVVDYENTWRRDGFWELGSLKTEEYAGVSRAVPGGSVDLRRPGFIKVPGLSRLSAGVTHYYEIRRTIREKDIDIIVLYSVATNGLQTIRAAREYGVPVVFRSIDILHKLVPAAPLRPVTRWLEKKVYARVNTILAITPNHARYVVSLGAAPGKVKLLLMPIDTGIFHPSDDYQEIRQKWGFTAKDRVVVFIGTLFPFTGLDGFIRQFPRVTGRVPDARLLIVGDGPQRPALERIIAAAGLAGQVTITGFQPYQTMPQYINLAAICVNPFLNTPATRDIFPGKIIQYLACGRATVATPLLGITSLAPDETRGVVYAEEAGEMAEKVADLLESGERRRALGQAGLEYVLQAHEQEKIARQLETELLAIVGKNQPAAAS
jgi:glycosyltransferase involved in cell wall biosynthesis